MLSLNISIIDTIYDNIASESNGGCFLITSINSFIICTNDKFSNCRSNQKGGCFFLDCKFCCLSCLSFFQNSAIYAPAIRIEKTLDTSYFNYSAISSSFLINGADITDGAPFSFQNSKIESYSLNHSNNIVNHISTIVLVIDRGSKFRFNQLTGCNSTNGVLIQFENSNECAEFQCTNIIKNNVGTSGFGLLRTYQSISKFSYCYIKDNIASIIFLNEDGTVYLVNSYVDVQLSSEIFAEIHTTNIESNILSISKCFTINKCFIYSQNERHDFKHYMQALLCQYFIISSS